MGWTRGAGGLRPPPSCRPRAPVCSFRVCGFSALYFPADAYTRWGFASHLELIPLRLSANSVCVLFLCYVFPCWRVVLSNRHTSLPCRLSSFLSSTLTCLLVPCPFLSDCLSLALPFVIPHGGFAPHQFSPPCPCIPIPCVLFLCSVFLRRRVPLSHTPPSPVSFLHPRSSIFGLCVPFAPADCLVQPCLRTPDASIWPP